MPASALLVVWVGAAVVPSPARHKQRVEASGFLCDNLEHLVHTPWARLSLVMHAICTVGQAHQLLCCALQRKGPLQLLFLGQHM